MSTEPQRTCPSCGNAFSGAMEFCPVCVLRAALPGAAESGASSFEGAIKPTPEPSAERYEHYELVTGEDGKPVGENCFYAMEFVEGETLESLIKRSGRVEAKLALEIMTQVATGLAAVDKKGLVHRDRDFTWPKVKSYSKTLERRLAVNRLITSTRALPSENGEGRSKRGFVTRSWPQSVFWQWLLAFNGCRPSATVRAHKALLPVRVSYVGFSVGEVI